MKIIVLINNKINLKASEPLCLKVGEYGCLVFETKGIHNVMIFSNIEMKAIALVLMNDIR